MKFAHVTFLLHLLAIALTTPLAKGGKDSTKPIMRRAPKQQKISAPISSGIPKTMMSPISAVQLQEPPVNWFNTCDLAHSVARSKGNAPDQSTPTNEYRPFAGAPSAIRSDGTSDQPHGVSCNPPNVPLEFQRGCGISDWPQLAEWIPGACQQRYATVEWGDVQGFNWIQGRWKTENYTRCSGHYLGGTKVADKAACQQMAVDACRWHFEYRDDTKLCNTCTADEATWTAIRTGRSDPWKIFAFDSPLNMVKDAEQGNTDGFQCPRDEVPRSGGCASWKCEEADLAATACTTCPVWTPVGR